jgi:hypothetical protein
MSRKRRQTAAKAGSDVMVAPAALSIESRMPSRGLGRFVEGSRALLWLGCVLLLGFVCWWGANLTRQPLPRAVPLQLDYVKDRITYIPFMPFLGLDFHHNYVAARAWREGKDPYQQLEGDPANVRYTYPPLTMVAFSWSSGFKPSGVWNVGPSTTQQSPFAPSVPAMLCWLVVIAAIVGIASWQSWCTRRQLGLKAIPFPFVLGAMLMSYPVCFELERGNCNALPLLALLVCVRALTWSDARAADIVAGLCVALATGIKPYAIVLLPGLLAVGRFRAAAFAAGWLLLEMVVFWPDIRRWLAVAHIQNQIEVSMYLDFSHSLISHWKMIWRDLGAARLAMLPAERFVAVTVLVVVGWVGWRVFRARDRTGVIWPFFLWLAAMATMISPVAQDYNLLFIPLAVLAAWNSADSWRVQLCVGTVLLWWQPFYLGLANAPWLLLKVVSVALIGVLISRRLQSPPRAIEPA